MRVGIIGCGRIAKTMAKTISETDGVEAVACASRDLAKAEAFAKENGVLKAYGSYEELYKASDVDIVYVATPMNCHAKQMLNILDYGKAILCEKSFCINAKEAEEVLSKAESKKLLVAEAIWTRYMPSRFRINEIIKSGAIGDVKFVSANLSYSLTFKERIMRKELGGGALLDIGVYPLNFALMVNEGKTLSSMSTTATLSDGGVDLRESMTLRFEDGSISSLFADCTTLSDRKGMIYGTDGMISVENVNNPERIDVFKLDETKRNFVKTGSETFTHKSNGFEYELLSCKKALEEGKTECPEMPHGETLRVMRIMDGLRHVWGVRLSNEE